MTPATTMSGHAPIAPARAPRRELDGERLLVIDPLTRRFGDYAIGELPQLLGRGDVLVVNDAATLPASLRAGPDLELRLIAAESDGSFRAIALGSGDFRVPTEQRGDPRLLLAGETLSFTPELSARIVEVDGAEPRLLRLQFVQRGATFWRALYEHARPIQYSYVPKPLALWDVQNRYAARPWAFELPSAGRPLTFETLFALEARGTSLTYVTHAAGVSATGSGSLDLRLPLAERYEISPEAAAALQRARGGGGRIIAAGTSVVRALEARADDAGSVTPGAGSTELRLTARYEPRVVDGLLTGLHESGTSHFELLEAFAPGELLLRAADHAGRTGYLQHEFGDSCLILPGALLERLTA
jgi:S-adenosylmethionine:tRNA ribosyltransferase-isomerase